MSKACWESLIFHLLYLCLKLKIHLSPAGMWSSFTSSVGLHPLIKPWIVGPPQELWQENLSMSEQTRLWLVGLIDKGWSRKAVEQPPPAVYTVNRKGFVLIQSLCISACTQLKRLGDARQPRFQWLYLRRRLLFPTLSPHKLLLAPFSHYSLTSHLPSDHRASILRV